MDSKKYENVRKSIFEAKRQGKSIGFKLKDKLTDRIFEQQIEIKKVRETHSKGKSGAIESKLIINGETIEDNPHKIIFNIKENAK